MKKSLFIILALALILFIANFVTNKKEQTGVDFSEKSQEAITEFATTLKASLTAGMQSGGPVEAITVCNQVAPTIATELSKKYGLEIARTSLKVRNTNNAADEWEEAVLNQFEARKQAGESVLSLTFSEQLATNEGVESRMMKAIPTDKVCLACHGTKIAEPIQASLDQLYPNDQATGFKLGDIRGAFTVRERISK